MRQLERLQRRAQSSGQGPPPLLLGAWRTSGFSADLGDRRGVGILRQSFVFRAIAVIALGIGTFAVTALVSGCVYMVHETRLAVQNLAKKRRLWRIIRRSNKQFRTLPSARSRRVVPAGVAVRAPQCAHSAQALRPMHCAAACQILPLRSRISRRALPALHRQS